MKLRVGDNVLVTGGKDKGKTGVITKVVPERDSVIVSGLNVYVKHVRPYADRSGERKELERPLPTSKVAILNDKKQPDRIGYSVAKDGTKVRVFKKTGKPVPEPKKDKK